MLAACRTIAAHLDLKKPPIRHREHTQVFRNAVISCFSRAALINQINNGLIVNA